MVQVVLLDALGVILLAGCVLPRFNHTAVRQAEESKPPIQL